MSTYKSKVLNHNCYTTVLKANNVIAAGLKFKMSKILNFVTILNYFYFKILIKLFKNKFNMYIKL